MAVSTEKQCVATTCSLRGMRVTTDLAACLGCGEPLRAATLSDLFAAMFDEPLSPFGQP